MTTLSRVGPPLEFTIRKHWHDLDAHRIGPARYVELPGLPFYLANKANARIVAVGGKRRRAFGGKQWNEVKEFERSVACATAHAIESSPAWLDSRPDVHAYRLELVLRYGDRIVQRRSTPKRRGGPQRMTAEHRCRRHDVDSVKAILDGMIGSAFVDDAHVLELEIRKEARTDGELGDEVGVRLYHLQTGGAA